MENIPQQEKRHIDRIDILRGIAILCVFLFHSQQFLFPDATTGKNAGNQLQATGQLKSTILNLLPTAYGWTGVELFLLISGFVIHFGFLSGGQKMKPSVFYSKRFWRIYPPYLIALLFFCFTGAGLKYYFGTHEGLKDVLTHLFFVHNLFDRYYYSINGVFWSLVSCLHQYRCGLHNLHTTLYHSLSYTLHTWNQFCRSRLLGFASMFRVSSTVSCC